MFINKILFATPIGYLLALLKIIDGDASPGVYIQAFEERTPFTVNVKINPNFNDRLTWIADGIILLVQAFFAYKAKSNITNETVLEILMGYMWISITFGFIVLVSGVFPNFPWNNRRYLISIGDLVAVIFGLGSAFLIFNS